MVIVFNLFNCTGTKNEIDAALTLLRGKFPLKRYPQVTLQQLNIAPEATIAPMLPDSIQVVFLKLLSFIYLDG